MIKYLAVISLLILSNSLFGQEQKSIDSIGEFYNSINSIRKIQLDEFVNNLDKKTISNLDSLHFYIHKKGENDQERVFMFYGLFAIHFKYDIKRARMSSKKAKEYTPYFTAQKRNGVCRDFAVLFKELCDRSSIPCVIASGRVKVNILASTKDFFLFRLKKSNHAWNVVKYNHSWHLMDVTWSKVDSVLKKTYKDNKGNNIKLKIKIASRDYYDPSFNFIYKKRKAEHPAFYTESTIYTYKTAFKKIKKRTVLNNNYDFFPTLDSLAKNPFYKFSEEFQDSSYAYSKNTSNHFYDHFITKFLDLKRTKLDPISISSCEKQSQTISELNNYLLKKDGKIFGATMETETKLAKKIDELKTLTKGK